MQDGIRSERSLSPYDVPEAVRGYVDRKAREFVIEFRYISAGEESMEVGTSNIKVVCGKNARVYRVRVALALFAGSRDKMLAEMKDALEMALDEKKRNSFGPAHRVRMAEGVIEDEAEQLFNPRLLAVS